MNTFHYNIIKVAVGVFIIFILICALTLYSINQNHTFPPFISQCPDYWTYNSNEKKCYPPVSKINTNDQQSFDVNILGNATISSVKCKKHEWAVSNNIEWSGISNYKGCE
jgi:hypothetical protein